MDHKHSPNIDAVRERPFAERLSLACDNHFQCPPLHKGRLVWVVEGFESKFGVTITTESVRKWLAGEGRPRPKRMTMLAELLLVDEAWLAVGGGQTTTDEVRVRNIMAGGAVNLVAGMIQLEGGHPAFPEADDKRGKDVDLYAIIKGAQFSFKVALAHSVDRKTNRFEIPTGYRDLFVIGVVRSGPLRWDLLELDSDTIDRCKTNRGSHFELMVERRGHRYAFGTQRLRQITSFAERL